MATNSLVDAARVVRNVIVTDNNGLPEDWQAPAGLTLVRADGGEVGGTWTGSEFVPPPPPQVNPAARWDVRKLLIIERLGASGFFSAAMAALGGPGNYAYERWSAAQSIASDDAEVRGLLQMIGADPDSILAVETGGVP